MNERYRWNEEDDRRSAEERAERLRRERGQGPDLSGRDYYGVSGPNRSSFERDRRTERPNHAWDGREPYPMDVGGVNRPGENRGHGLEPLTGDRGSAEQQELWRGDDIDYGRDPRAEYRQGRARYLEGGYEPRGHYGELEHEARSWWARARDEFRSWMGDREAERRLRMDHAEEERHGRHGGDWRGHDDDTGWRDPISAADVRNEYERDRGSPREHRPGFFRDDDGRW